MQVTFLSIASVILTILKCHNMVTLEWWMVFSPAVVDLIIGFFEYVERKRNAEIITQALMGDFEEEDE